MRRERRKLSSKTALAEAMDYSLKRWTALTRFIDNGCICLSNNAAERAVRGIAVGRRNWTFARHLCVRAGRRLHLSIWARGCLRHLIHIGQPVAFSRAAATGVYGTYSSSS